MSRVALPFVLFALSLPSWAGVNVSREGGRIAVEVDGRPFTNLVLEGEGVMKPYFHPIYASSGKIVSRRYPMETVAGESKDHPHHRGLWFTHGDVNGLDFWSADPSRKGDKYGRVELQKVISVESGKDRGSLRAVFEWKDPAGNVLLTEDRTVLFREASGGVRMMDFDVRFRGVAKAHFGDTKEGTFAIRVADSMNEKNGGVLENATGVRGERNVWGKPSPYMSYYGIVDGEPHGISIFDHPSNPGHPTHWHVRAYGLFAANIFGERDFYNDKSRDGGRTLEPGQTWRFRYRVVIYPGAPGEAGIAALYKEYAR